MTPRVVVDARPSTSANRPTMRATGSIQSHALGESVTFLDAHAEAHAGSRADTLVMEACFAPHRPAANPVLHYHPAQDEHFEVLDGVLAVEQAGVARTYGAGERFDVPRGTAHRMHNPGDGPARVRWEVRPALRTREFLTAAFAAADAGALLHPAGAEALLREYADVFRVPAPAAGAGTAT